MCCLRQSQSQLRMAACLVLQSWCLSVLCPGVNTWDLEQRLGMGSFRNLPPLGSLPSLPDPPGPCPSPVSAHSCPCGWLSLSLCLTSQGPHSASSAAQAGWVAVNPQEGDNPALTVGAALSNACGLFLIGPEAGRAPGLSPGEISPPRIPKSSSVPKPPIP